MTDYYPLIARAVEGIEKNTGEARRSLYERARTALVAQLRGLDPPLSESEITRERLALDEAIRKVEAEAARRARTEAQRPAAADTAKPPGEAREKSDLREASPPKAPSESARPSPGAPADAPRSPDARAPGRARSQLAEQALKGFRDGVTETDALGGAHAAHAGREASQADKTPEFDRLEPRLELSARAPAREPAPPRPADRLGDAAARRAPSRAAEPATPPEPPKRSRKPLVAALVTILMLVVIAAAAYVQRDRIAGFLGVKGGPPSQAQRDATPSQPKITDRVGRPGESTAPVAPSPGQDAQQTAPAAQRVVLYEEDPGDPAGKRYIGSAIWRTETVSPGAGQPPEIVVRCDVEIPERRLTMTMSLRRNTDKALPASHTIEIMFSLPADFPFGGISNVPGILMKQAEQTRGSPLAGLAVKVTANFFLVGLSSVETDLQRNLQLLKERGWFDIPIVYNNGRRAIIAIEKGPPGERAFAEAFAAWGQ